MENKAIKNADYDSWSYFLNKLPLATHLYYMDMNLWGNKQYNLAPFSQSGQVLNLLYMPFIGQDDLELLKIPYDQEHYGTVKENPSSETDYAPQCDVYKVMNQINITFNLKNIQKYPDVIRERPTQKSWKNESKIFQYPYSYITINDFINSPLKLQYHLIPTNDIEIKAKQPLSITGGYTIYVDGYKGDKNAGSNEGLLSNGGLDLPTSSSQYAQFMSTSKASFIAQNEISARNESVGLRTASQSMGGQIAGSMLNPSDWLGIIGSTVSSVNQNSITEQQIKKDRQNFITSAQAQLQDLHRSPRSVNLSSSDILMSLNRNNKKIYANRYTIQDYYKNRLCEYFTLYGYKQNKMMLPNLKSRKYFNYIKTLDANIQGNNMDKSELDQLKEIFNSGITFWHYFNTSRDLKGMYDYSKDNKEV